MTEPRPAAPPAPRRQPVSLSALALAFLKIALSSLGGGLSAWALRVIVEERRWLTEEQFLAALTICRILPGPNQVNMAVYVGTRLRGLPGAGRMHWRGDRADLTEFNQRWLYLGGDEWRPDRGAGTSFSTAEILALAARQRHAHGDRPRSRHLPRCRRERRRWPGMWAGARMRAARRRPSDG